MPPHFQDKSTTRAKTPLEKTELKKLSRFVFMNEKKVREPRSTFELTEIEKNDRGFKNERRLQFDARSTKREVQNVRIYFKKLKRGLIYLPGRCS